MTLALIEATLDAANRFHAQPLDDKLALRANEHNVGYMPVNSSVSRASQVEKARKPNLVEAFFLKRAICRLIIPTCYRTSAIVA